MILQLILILFTLCSIPFNKLRYFQIFFRELHMSNHIQATVNIINGETIVHIPKHIINQLGSVADGEKLNVIVDKGQIVISKN